VHDGAYAFGLVRMGRHQALRTLSGHARTG
jgi:hypothetical protein